MKCVLDKKKGIPLPQQLKDALLARIEQGYYKPGERIDTVRKLAEEFGVSSLTVQKACKLLEDENCLISMPQSGLFVPENFFERPGKPLRMVFVFPEMAITSQVLEMEIWGLSSELYRGFLAGAQEHSVQLDFLHIGQNSSFREKFRQIERIHENYDCAIFVGDQNRDIQLELAERDFAVFNVADQPELIPETLHPIYYNHEKALDLVMDSALASGARTIAVLTLRVRNENYLGTRHSCFVSLCRRNGIGPDRLFAQTLDENDLYQLPEILKRIRGSFIFCNNAYLVRDLFVAARKNGMIPGKDFQIMAIASGVTFTGLIPALTYVRVPMYEIGYRLIRSISEMQRNGSKSFRWQPVEPELIAGETCRRAGRKTNHRKPDRTAMQANG
ncbi:MAG: GntR family transcriptional regulator [Lentisphaeria bacterium]|nr:GntR family transcriptional regulator [Lentisphaeria bacterium]